MLNKLKQIIERCILGVIVILLIMLISTLIVKFFWWIVIMLLLGILTYILGDASIRIIKYQINKRKEVKSHVK